MLANTSRWLTTQQTSEYINCSVAFLERDRVTRLHGIPFSRLGRCVRYDKLELDKFLERSKVQNGGLSNA
jgi:excisionase family DNA binding protein